MSYRYNSIDEIRSANRNAGRHFFDESTLRFFYSRIHDGVYEGRYFITSEKGPTNVRYYTVRRANEDATITTMGEFQNYGTHRDAQDAIEDHAWEDES